MKEFLIGGFASSIAEAVTLPIDTLKVRLQLEPDLTLTRFVGEEQISSLFRGLQPAVVRQITYGGLRIGLYPIFKEMWAAQPYINGFGFWNKMLSGSVAGAVSSAICSPIDLVCMLIIYSFIYNHSFIL